MTLISGLRVNGEPHPLSALGQVHVAPIDSRADRNHLQIDFGAIDFDPLIDRDGNGLASMGRRARALGGRLDVMSRGDAGTTVRVALSLARSRPRMFGPLHRQVGDRDESGR